MPSISPEIVVGWMEVKYFLLRTASLAVPSTLLLPGVEKQSKEAYGCAYSGEIRTCVCQVWCIFMVFQVSPVVRTANLVLTGAMQLHQ